MKILILGANRDDSKGDRKITLLICRFKRTILRIAVFVLIIPLLNKCECSGESQERLSRLVWIKYAHVANVHMLQPYGRSVQLFAADQGGFWAIFDICSIDVQGSAIKSFNYNANNFYVEMGNDKYGPMNSGLVGYADATAANSNDAKVVSDVYDALQLSPSTQSFPKGLYPGLSYRIAVFVKEWPKGYHGEALGLNYDNHPVITQNIYADNPQFIPFYNSDGSPRILRVCRE